MNLSYGQPLQKRYKDSLLESSNSNDNTVIQKISGLDGDSFVDLHEKNGLRQHAMESLQKDHGLVVISRLLGTYCSLRLLDIGCRGRGSCLSRFLFPDPSNSVCL